MQAVFGPVGADGYPKPIWDKRTGRIDPDVATYWREHADLGYILQTRLADARTEAGRQDSPDDGGLAPQRPKPLMSFWRISRRRFARSWR